MTRLLPTLIVALLTVGLVGCEEQITQPSDQTVLQSNSAAAGESGDALSKRGSVLNFVAPLSGDQEVPPIDSDGTGLAEFQLREGSMELGYKLIASNIDGVTQSHIHCGPAGANGPVVVFLFGFVAGGVTPHGILAEGTITPADVIQRPDSEVCPGGVADFEDLIEKMQEGGTYVNVHTVAHPPGEIRGQIEHGNGVTR